MLPVSFDEKYKGQSAADLIAARIQIEKLLALRNAEILGEMIKRGQCEVITHKVGEETRPKMPVGWASRIDSTPQEDGTEIVRVAIFDPRSRPDTEAFVKEAEWLAQRSDSAAGMHPSPGDHPPR